MKKRSWAIAIVLLVALGGTSWVVSHRTDPLTQDFRALAAEYGMNREESDKELYVANDVDAETIERFERAVRALSNKHGLGPSTGSRKGSTVDGTMHWTQFNSARSYPDKGTLRIGYSFNDSGRLTLSFTGHRFNAWEAYRWRVQNNP